MIAVLLGFGLAIFIGVPMRFKLGNRIGHEDFHIKQARAIVADIQELLRATGHEARLIRSKYWLFEAALNAGELYTAEAGFRGNRDKTAENTRVHLEATAFLVVCLLRQRKISGAEPLIAKVLQGKANKDPSRRRKFIQSVTKRFQLESYLSAIQGLGDESLSADAIDAEAVKALKTNSEEELYGQIAAALPREVIEFVFRVARAARKQLPMMEVLYQECALG